MEVGELSARHPTHLLTLSRMRDAGQLTFEEVQLDEALGVGVPSDEDLGTDVRVHCELLEHLSTEALVERLTGLTLASRELPAPCEVRSLEAPGQEERAVLFDDRGGNHDWFARGHVGRP